MVFVLVVFVRYEDFFDFVFVEMRFKYLSIGFVYGFVNGGFGFCFRMLRVAVR